MTNAVPRLLVAVAHPDDETFGMGGTMAKLAHEGWGVTIVCATRGEVGEISDPSLATPENLGAVREQELRDACAVFGVHDVRFLDYRDSGMAGTPDNADPRSLASAGPEQVIEAFVTVLRELRPRVVLTWDPSGGYGHPDHIAVHKYMTAAFEQAAGGTGGSSLYFQVIPVEQFARMAEELEKQGIELISPAMRERMLELPRLPATTAIDVAAYLPLKFESGTKHATQMPADGPFARVPRELREQMMSQEHFHRASPLWHDGDPIEHAFFGVATPE